MQTYKKAEHKAVRHEQLEAGRWPLYFREILGRGWRSGTACLCTVAISIVQVVALSCVASELGNSASHCLVVVIVRCMRGRC